MVPVPLPVVADGIQQPELDIVSIPGLPTLHPHYKLKDHDKWLREVLSHQVPQARIMAFQYDFGKDSSSTTWSNLLDQPATFLHNLASKREDAPDRPMIFICFSFGAIILKKVLHLAKTTNDFWHIFDSTKGVIFIACIHDEAFTDFEDVCLKCAAVEFGSKKRHASLENLRKKSKDDEWRSIKEAVEMFRLLRCRFPVWTLYERKTTSCSTEGFSLKSKKDEWLCSEAVSSLGWANETQIGVDKDHSQLTSYPSRGDTGGFFEQFLTIVTDLVDAVCPPKPRPVEVGQQDAWTIVNPSTSSVLNSPPSGPSGSLSSPSLTSVAELALQPRLPCYVMTPFEVNPHFEGRGNILHSIHTSVGPSSHDKSRNRSFVIAGMGGMGKTQVALSYAFRYQNEYQVVLCADADGKAKLADSFILFAKELGLGDNLTSIKAKQAVKDCLKTLDKPWLMIFDNADGDDKDSLLLEFCPEVGLYGSVLITTRDVTLLNRHQYEGIELDELSVKEATDLLLKLTGQNRVKTAGASAEDEREIAEKITRKLGRLPLGIIQAASIVVHDSCSLSEFLDAYNHRNIITDFQDLQLQPSQGSYKYSLSTVWNMNFDKLGDDERNFINLLSFLDPDQIQMSILNDGVARLKSAEFSFIGTRQRVIKCRRRLLGSTLISQSNTGEEMRMHRLMQTSCHLRMSQEERRLHFSRAVNLLIAVWPVPDRTLIHNPSLWKAQRMLLPHVQSICEAYRWSCDEGQPLIDEDIVNWNFAKLLYEAGWFCYESGLVECVYDILNPAKEYCLFHLSKGGGYRILADIYGGLGSVWTETNQFRKVYDDFHEQWKYIQLAFDSGEMERPSIWEVFGLGRLGNAFHGLHRYEEAEEYYRKCLEAWEGLPGDQKIFRTHLATCLWLQGRPDEGEAVVRPIIKDWDDVTNFRTAMAIYSLGNIMIAQATNFMRDGKREQATAKFAESMDAHTRVLKLWTEILGARHHKTADAMYKVAWHYHRNKLYVIAINFLNDALDVYEGQPTLFKNEIARTKYKLGCVLQDQGDWEKGAELVRTAENLRKEIVPAEDWEPAGGEEDFDEIVQFWTR